MIFYKYFYIFFFRCRYFFCCDVYLFWWLLLEMLRGGSWNFVVLIKYGECLFIDVLLLFLLKSRVDDDVFRYMFKIFGKREINVYY